ncbi:PPE-repeat protein [Mycolicibacterium sp. BK634]|uniref:PPE family protein n=1 Tax=Mycolicibacterium sp. BK634 TaxID=2587099 RepID=UPI001616B901|nr:PPE family protein [Mycolicibacterium sp. BK634]MBB3753648.1 PPE-repeat protein [Mycolicibacterium sp. BK634]
MTFPAIGALDYGVLPPEINSGRIWAGPGSASLQASAVAWQTLAAQLGSSTAAFQSVLEALTGAAWLGPSSISMAASAAPYVVWMMATAAQCEQAAAAAAQAAMVFEAAHAGVVPPPLIEANRNLLVTLVNTNFMGFNTGAIAATEGEYDHMWGQDATVMYGYSADAAGLTGTLVPFVPPAPMTDPSGLATQAASVAQASGQAAGQAGQHAAEATQGAAMPAGMDAQSMVSMAPQLMGMFPQMLQSLAQPAMQGFSAPLQSMGQFQSLLSPFMSMVSNPGMLGGVNAAGATGPAAALSGGLGAGLSGLGGGGGGLGAISAGLGGAGRLGGLSVPATWAASAQQSGTSTAVLTTATAPATAAPAAASGGGATGMAPMGAMGGRESGDAASGPRYGTPIRVLPRPR